MSVIVLAAVAAFQSPAFEFKVATGSGLSVIAKGIPVIRGSGFQYYAPGWTKGYYSSKYKPQTIRQVDADTVDVQFAEGDVAGSTRYHREGTKLVVDYTFEWKSAELCQIELNTGLLWEPPFHGASATLDGKTRTLPQLAPVGGLDKRALGAAALSTQLSGAAVKLTTSSSEPITTFDGRKYDQDWAEDASVFWQGVLGLAIHKGEPKKVHIEYQIVADDAPSSTVKKLDANPNPQPDVVIPDTTIAPLIPSPKMSLLDYGNLLVITNNWSLPAGRPKFFDLFRSELEKRFELPAATANGPKVIYDGGMSDFKKPSGTYHLKISKDSISVYGQEAMGLRNAVYRLAQLAFVKDGKICLPTGVIEDEPRSEFRGVHLFVGPKALEFHQKLWTNVLRPLGFNKVVLQCERTDWKSLPGVQTSITMKQEDLAKLFSWYRSIEVEPIPLIQSFGHMEWAFANNKNRELAINPAQPYAIDPRKPEAKAMIGKVWDEAIALLHPKTIHVGLDEVDMIGFPKKDPALVTSLWQEMLPYLGSVAKRNNVNLMLWGDEGLGPNEAIDAMNGDDAANAAARRKAIPKGATIADWHYKPTEYHVPFLDSLKLWKQEGFEPLASMWYRPENIRGYSIAADVESVGTLQTTWNGYESNEDNMLRDLKQYSAMVLAGDFGWSARLEKVDELPYDPLAIFAKMYNPHKSPLVATPGTVFGFGGSFACGGVKFAKLEGNLVGIDSRSASNPTSVSVDYSGTAQEVALALVTGLTSPEGEQVGSVFVTYADGTSLETPIKYGLQVRSDSDPKGTFFGVRENDRTCLRIAVLPKAIRSITVSASNRYSGLRVEGISVIPLKGKRNL